jgi:hypothetical protein
MLRAVTDTSMAAYQNLPTASVHSQCTYIIDIITQNGHPMTGQQIKLAYFRKHGITLDIGTISARVNRMCNETFDLQRRIKKVKCPISGQRVNPIGLPVRQLELIN